MTKEIGGYQVHPVAAMFPLLKGAEYENFKASIRDLGQLDPIRVQGKVLLDGRNRLRACLDLGLTPKVSEFGEGDDATTAKHILDVNTKRRHIGDDVRAYITTEAVFWIESSEAAKRQEELGKKGGQLGGRGHKHKKPLISSDTKGFHATGRTRQKIAEHACVSYRQVDYSVQVFTYGSDELKSEVRSGKVALHKAVKRLRKPSAPTPKISRKSTISRRALQIAARESEILFDERLLKLAQEPLAKLEIYNRRLWHVENISKIALTQGLLAVVHELELRLASIKAEHPVNSGKSTKEELAPNQPMGLERVN